MRYLLTTLAFCCCAAGVYAEGGTEEVAVASEEVAAVPVDGNNESGASAEHGGCGCSKTKK
jgi:hypothetical protein